MALASFVTKRFPFIWKGPYQETQFSLFGNIKTCFFWRDTISPFDSHVYDTFISYLMIFHNMVTKDITFINISTWQCDIIHLFVESFTQLQTFMEHSKKDYSINWRRWSRWFHTSNQEWAFYLGGIREIFGVF